MMGLPAGEWPGGLESWGHIQGTGLARLLCRASAVRPRHRRPPPPVPSHPTDQCRGAAAAAAARCAMAQPHGAAAPVPQPLPPGIDLSDVMALAVGGGGMDGQLPHGAVAPVPAAGWGGLGGPQRALRCAGLAAAQAGRQAGAHAPRLQQPQHACSRQHAPSLLAPRKYAMTSPAACAGSAPGCSVPTGGSVRLQV